MSKKIMTVGQTNSQDIGCLKVYDVLFTRYYAKVRDFVYTTVRNENEAEDITQDISLKLWIQRGEVGVVDNWDAYLYAMARNYIPNVLKQKMHEHNLRSYPGTGVPEENFLEKMIFSGELKTILESVISKMPDQRRRVFTMSRLQGMANQKIIQALHISRCIIETHISTIPAQIGRVVMMAVVSRFPIS